MVQIASCNRLYWRKIPLVEKEGLGKIFVISDWFSSFDKIPLAPPFTEGERTSAVGDDLTNAGFRSVLQDWERFSQDVGLKKDESE